MSGDDDYVNFLCELLGAAGSISARRMFGGHGIYCDGMMFGLVADGRLYLKVDDVSRAQFEAVGCGPFVFTGKGKPISMSYYAVPDEALDSAEAMLPWARLGVAAAARKQQLRSERAPRRKRSKVKPTSTRAKPTR